MKKDEQEWWRGGILYQIYPRSFFSAAGNDTGDLRGITEKIPYIKSLGVEGIWICPFYPSPMKDFGYDVSDYRGVDPLFGTLDDFDALVSAAHGQGLKVIIDLVLSHTSDQHPWFCDPDKKDWYVWADARDGGPPNNWVSIFGGSAWSYDERYGQYYFHNFLKEQPDLNYHNPQVQAEALEIARFWLARGVDGFRLDTVNFYFHDRQLRDNPPSVSEVSATQFEGDDPYSGQAHVFDKSQPENLVFVRRLRALLDEYGAMAVGEIGDDDPVVRAAEYTGPGFLHTAYNLQMMVGQSKQLTPALIREPIEEALRHEGSWPSWAFSNHDVVRAVSRWDADPKFLIALLGCLYGTVFLYQGEELGLPEAALKFEDLQDPWGKHLWPAWQGRDGCRTPMPWNAQKPKRSWLPVPEEHLDLNVSDQSAEDTSVLNFTRRFLAWRQGQEALKAGLIGFDTSREAEHILRFTRSLNGQEILCDFNCRDFSFQIEGFLSA